MGQWTIKWNTIKRRANMHDKKECDCDKHARCHHQNVIVGA